MRSSSLSFDGTFFKKRGARRYFYDAPTGGYVRALNVQGSVKALSPARLRKMPSRRRLSDVGTLGNLGVGVSFPDGAFAFDGYSAAYYWIVTPEKLGGDATTWFFLTTTNRTAKGTESLAVYNAQAQAEFAVFDWSLPQPTYVKSIGYPELDAKYLRRVHVSGRRYRGLFVANVTRLVSGTTWSNDVLLKRNDGAYAWVYSRQYALASNDEQRGGWWGPIGETFQTYAQPIERVGFKEFTLLQEGEARRPTASDSTLNRNGSGLQLTDVDPNQTWLAE